MTQPPDTWMLAGVVIQGYLKTLDRMGLREAVRERVPEPTRLVMDKPPLVISTVKGTVLDDILVAVSALRGPQAPREVAFAAARDTFGPVLKSLISATISLFGPSPRSVFERLGTVAATMVRKVEYKYEPLAEKAGVVSIAFPSPVPESTHTAWEGILEYVYVMVGAKGTARHRPRGAARTADLDVRWGD